MSKKENKSLNTNDELKIESIAKINDFQDTIKSNSNHIIATPLIFFYILEVGFYLFHN